MATVQTRITRALRLLNEIPSGEEPTDDELADGLTALNAMLDSWRNDGLMCYAWQDETLPLSNGDASYTIGPAGDLATTRPVSIREAYVVVDNTTYPVILRDEEWWAGIPDKTQQSDWPTDALFRPSMPTATLLVYPVPNATRTMKLVTRVVAGPFTAVTDTVTLPPGWEAAIDFNLAIELAPEYQATPSPAVIKRAMDTIAGIKRANIQAQPVQVTTELAALFPARSGNIYTDEP